MGEFQLTAKRTVIPVHKLAVITLLIAIPLFLFHSSYNKYSVSPLRGDYSGGDSRKDLDLFSGEWVRDPTAPSYTNWTCYAIQEFSCMKAGRPDDGYMKWRWRPDSGELPAFDAAEFLRMMRGKAMGFVGDSLARNQVDSLVCLLSTVATPVLVAEKFGKKVYRFIDHNFNLSISWSVYLVHSEATVIDDYSYPFNIFLDEFDLLWTNIIAEFDYIIISSGRWFTRPTYLYLNRTLLGCLHCNDLNLTHYPISFAYGHAFKTAFRAINSDNNFSGTTILRTFSPSHYDGAWNKGGDCLRRKPLRREEMQMEDTDKEMYAAQLEELGIAMKSGKRKFRLLDVTMAMALRPDAHPSHYGRKRGVANDCVHWCLPGPIDAWNSMLQELLRREY